MVVVSVHIGLYLVTYPASSKTPCFSGTFFLDYTGLHTGVHKSNCGHELMSCHLYPKLYCLATQLPIS